MVGWSRCISSMKSTSPFSRLVKSPASSPAFSITGPLVFLMFTLIALAMMYANVVLPRPDGPLNKICSITSPRFFAASTISSSRSRTFTWPVNSLKAGGRSEISNAASDSGGFIRACDEFITLGRGSRASLFQVFRQHQFGAAAFMYVIDFIKGFANEIETQPARLDDIMRAALHFMVKDLFTIIAQAQAHAIAQPLHAQ